MEKYYFLKTITEKGSTRVRMLSNQTVPVSNGSTTYEKVDVTKNVSCDKEERRVHPIGTIFVAHNVYCTSGFYKVDSGTIYPLHQLPKDHDAHGQYEDLMGVRFETKEETKATSKPKPASLLDKLMSSKALKPPTALKDGFHVEKDVWYYILRNIALNKNTMLVGPTGSGKTELITKAAKVAERELQILDMGAMQDPISGLLGVHRLEGDESVFDQAKFTKYVQEENIILLDEISRAPSTANNILFPCLDSRRELPLEIASSKVARVLPVNEDCCFFATANLGAEYTGTQTLDRALMDRFSLVELDYMPKGVESKVLQNRVKIDKPDADMIASLGQTIRNMFVKGDLSTPISTRHTLEIASLVRDGFSITKSFEFVLFPMYEGTKSEGERSTLYSLLTSK